MILELGKAITVQYDAILFLVPFLFYDRKAVAERSGLKYRENSARVQSMLLVS
jgi:hypothetical protein